MKESSRGEEAKGRRGEKERIHENERKGGQKKEDGMNPYYYKNVYTPRAIRDTGLDWTGLDWHLAVLGWGGGVGRNVEVDELKDLLLDLCCVCCVCRCM